MLFWNLNFELENGWRVIVCTSGLLELGKTRVGWELAPTLVPEYKASRLDLVLSLMLRAQIPLWEQKKVHENRTREPSLNKALGQTKIK